MLHVLDIMLSPAQPSSVRSPRVRLWPQTLASQNPRTLTALLCPSCLLPAATARGKGTAILLAVGGATESLLVQPNTMDLVGAA